MEAVDTELDRLITRRASTDNREDPIEREESWKMSVRAHHAALRDANREAWCEYHKGQAERLGRHLAALVAYHEEQARKLLEGAA
ncbi:MAG: hypothetical protein M3522_01490 [Actinomycetota bacterium]|nr:hypothetical protein [Actinomycetota bacterium]